MPFPYIRPISAFDQPNLMAGFRPNHLVDAANRLRISTPLTLFEHNNQAGTNIFKWDKLTSGTGSVTDGSGSTMGATFLSTGGIVAGAKAIRATRYYIHQASGKDIWAGQAFVFGNGTLGVVKRVGYYDDQNGCFMEQFETTINLVVRRAGVDTKIPQGQWSDDNLDGNGPSGIVFNPAAGDTSFRVEMIGGIGIRFYLYINNSFILIHSVPNVSRVVVISTQTANLTLRSEIFNNTTAAAIDSLKVTGSNVFAEGAEEQVPAFIGAGGNGVSTVTVTTRRPILSIRANTLGINGIDRNFGQIVPQNLGIFTDAAIYLEAVYNGVLTGAAFSPVGATSVASIDASATAITGGVVPFVTYVIAQGSGANAVEAIQIGGQNVFERFPAVYSSLNNVQDIISIVATAITGTAHVGAALNWTEIY